MPAAERELTGKTCRSRRGGKKNKRSEAWGPQDEWQSQGSQGSRAAGWGPRAPRVRRRELD
eukprot:389044-Alexandrium_andersonii.AAC.1